MKKVNLRDLYPDVYKNDYFVEVTEETPAFRDIFIKNVTAKNVGRAILFNGLPEMPLVFHAFTIALIF